MGDVSRLTTTHVGILMADSRMVAEKFGKLHKDVLRTIGNLQKDCPEEFWRRNFAPSSYLNEQNKKQPMVEMTQDGFSLLAMGFTGSEAIRWKIRYLVFQHREALEVTMQEIPVSNVVFRHDLYPRIQTNPDTVQKYADDLDVLPPIIVNQHNELIDGWHRWTAHRQMEADNIKVTVMPTASDADLLEQAIRTNATHGLQLSNADKRNMARKIYHTTPERDRDEKKAELASILSVSSRTVRNWLSRIDKDAKEARNTRIFDMWLACHTQEEIAADVETPRKTVADVTDSFGEIGNLSESAKTLANHADPDFKPPLYNVWRQQEKTEGTLKL